MFRKLAVTTALTIALAGCATQAPQDSEIPEQSVETACALIETSMQELAVDMQENDEQEDVQEMVDAALRHLDALSAEVTNPEVAEAWAPISDLQKQGLVAAAEGDDEGAAAAYQQMADAYTDFWKICPSGNSD